jgi:hypothetical protein
MEEHELKDFGIDYARILTSDGLMAITKLLAMQRMANPYQPVGEWFKSLSDSDILTLIDDQNFTAQHGDYILISEMLATGEGLPPSESFDTFTFRAQSLMAFLLVESLYRKDLIKLHRENMSFDEDMAKNVLAEKRDDIDYSKIIDDMKGQIDGRE